MKTKTCPICKAEYRGYGNNSQPICEGFCCDDCNFRVVIPARMSRAKQ